MDEPAKDSPAQSTGSLGTEPSMHSDVQKGGSIATDMHIKVHSPFKVYYDGRASSISAVNDTGPFDILAGHRNFMTLVSACELIIREAGGSEQKIKIARAVMHVKANEVTVFLDV